MVDSFECLDYWILVFSIFYVSNRVGPVLIVLNISDLEVVFNLKTFFIICGTGRLDKTAISASSTPQG